MENVYRDFLGFDMSNENFGELCIEGIKDEHYNYLSIDGS